MMRQSVEAEAPIGSECQLGQGGGHAPRKEQGQRHQSTAHTPRMKAIGGKSGRTILLVDTLAVFQLAMFWLKALASEMICEPHR